ncbi:glycerophosphodiester phosphodiesterase [Weissella thailandensis]|uniref:Glycerophosphodiester phosphodiesterase n=1 Tax=Weissella thailandensis TaxID=89061 RepID=A0ABX9I765_9LACO|nr:glycerophosphodiester phosphodiesterase [Weissella thailandensis]NKY90354.1 glycerophosphodiester phosphodiesterase [Weissella thailandensis]RDS60417.1 glycerophosphodiester phosphodiesterase [Weissella thailandensis]GEP75283.1 hypothetical protein WTH01_15300 [Weissella thailandensis]
MHLPKRTIIAHRGVHDRGTKENSLAAFQRAIDMEAEGLELDVQLANDRLVLKHDINAEETKDLPTFKDFLALIKASHYNGFLLIELKGRDGAKELYKQLQAAGLSNQLMLQSFWEQPLREWRTLDKRVPIGYLRHYPNRLCWRLAKDKIIQQVNLDYRYAPLRILSPWWLPTYWWTINRPSVTGLLMHLNVAAVITDDIKQALKYRKRK